MKDLRTGRVFGGDRDLRGRQDQPGPRGNARGERARGVEQDPARSRLPLERISLGKRSLTT